MRVPRGRDGLQVGVVVGVEERRREDRAVLGGEVLGNEDHGRERRVGHGVHARQFALDAELHVVGEDLGVVLVEVGEDLQPHRVEHPAHARAAVVQEDRVADPRLHGRDGGVVVFPDPPCVEGRVAQALGPIQQPVARAHLVGERPAHVPRGPVVPLAHEAVRVGDLSSPARGDRRHDQVGRLADHHADVIDRVVEALDLLARVEGDDAGVVAELLEDRGAVDRLQGERRFDTLALGHHVGGEELLEPVFGHCHPLSRGVMMTRKSLSVTPQGTAACPSTCMCSKTVFSHRS